MPTINWPTALPKPQQGGYSSTTDPLLIVTQFDRNFRQRPKYDKSQDVVNVTWRLTQLQLDLFRTFLHRVLKNGALEFVTTIIGLDGPSERTVRIQGGKFSFRPLSGGWYDVSAVLIGTTPPGLDEDLYEFLLSLEDGDIDAFLLGASILSLYIEEFYGQSSANPDLQAFLNAYL